MRYASEDFKANVSCFFIVPPLCFKDTAARRFTVLLFLFFHALVVTGILKSMDTLKEISLGNVFSAIFPYFRPKKLSIFSCHNGDRLKTFK